MNFVGEIARQSSFAGRTPSFDLSSIHAYSQHALFLEDLKAHLKINCNRTIALRFIPSCSCLVYGFEHELR